METNIQKLKIGVLLFETFHGRANIGSSRIRGHWLIKNWNNYPAWESELEMFKMGQAYDCVIYQKAYWVEHATEFKGIKILDICDADWLHWGYRIKQMIDLCDAVTTSTETQAEYLRQLTDKPVVCISDSIDFETIGELKKEHHGETRRVGWFGYSENFPMLEAALPALIKLKIPELIVIASPKQPFIPPASLKDRILITNIPWTDVTVNRDLLKCDVIVNPKTNAGRWKYKSNNKTIHAWALGLPVAHNDGELKSFLTEEARIAEAEKRYVEVREKYDIRKSVAVYKNLINQLCQSKNQSEAPIIPSTTEVASSAAE
jgi:hypothetical protein